MFAFQRRPALSIALLLALTAFGQSPASCRAQSLWLPRDTKNAVMLEMLRPNVEGFNGELLSGALFLDARFNAYRVALVCELPLARMAGEEHYYYYGYPYYGYGSIDAKAVGNPYVGIESKSETTPIFLEFGFRPPVARESVGLALANGAYSDLARWEAFASRTTTIQAAFNLAEVTPHHVAYRLRVSPVVTIPNSGDSDLWMHYSFGIGYQGRCLRIGGGMSGFALLTADFFNLGTRTDNQFDLHGDFLSGAIRPGLEVRVPLGQDAVTVPVAAGVTLTWAR